MGLLHKTSALLTVAEAARILGRDRRTVSNWLHEDRIPRLGIEIAGRIYVRRHVLERVILGDEGATHLAPVA